VNYQANLTLTLKRRFEPQFFWMLIVSLDHGVVLGWIEMVCGNENVRCGGPKVFKQHMWCGGTCDMSGVVVFGNDNDHEKEDFLICRYQYLGL
jgi:hypothetical protein